MGDPVIEKARQVLQAVSDDPLAQELARVRINAQVTRRLEEAALRAEGRAEALRVSIAGLCHALAIPMEDTHRAVLSQSDAAALQAIFDALVRDRAWPSSSRAAT